MRIYINPSEAFREIERDLFEMSVPVQIETMQDKVVANDPGYLTLEVRGYGFKIVEWPWNADEQAEAVNYVLTGKKGHEPHSNLSHVLNYIELEFQDRIGGVPLNPGNAYQSRTEVWGEFLHDGKFAYTYSERISPQLHRIMRELADKPGTRQAIVNIHSNIQPTYHNLRPGIRENVVYASADMQNMGGGGRIPCSMYYQLMIREGKLDLIYTMRSCDFITHFPVDIMLALKLQTWAAAQLQKPVGTFTWFAGSLHCYKRDIADRGIF